MFFVSHTERETETLLLVSQTQGEAETCLLVTERERETETPSQKGWFIRLLCCQFMLPVSGAKADCPWLGGSAREKQRAFLSVPHRERNRDPSVLCFRERERERHRVSQREREKPRPFLLELERERERNRDHTFLRHTD